MKRRRWMRNQWVRGEHFYRYAWRACFLKRQGSLPSRTPFTELDYSVQCAWIALAVHCYQDAPTAMIPTP